MFFFCNLGEAAPLIVLPNLSTDKILFLSSPEKPEVAAYPCSQPALTQCPILPSLLPSFLCFTPPAYLSCHARLHGIFEFALFPPFFFPSCCLRVASDSFFSNPLLRNVIRVVALFCFVFFFFYIPVRSEVIYEGKVMVCMFTHDGLKLQDVWGGRGVNEKSKYKDCLFKQTSGSLYFLSHPAVRPPLRQ